MLTVGQKLWFVPSDLRYENHAKFATVEKVGRKWATLDNGYRIDIDGLWADGSNFACPGKCYLDKEAYEAEQAANSAFMLLKNRLAYTLKEGVTLADIQQAAKLLKVD